MSAAFTRPPLLEPALEALPGVLGRYRLGRKLATGGMATVYLAVSDDSAYVARPLALKRIHPHLASEKAFVDMFIDEARIASRLQHPNLCGVLDFGEADGSYFMTMEYLIGEPLSRVGSALARRAEPVPPQRLARVAAQILCDACEGLHSAHELRDDNGEALNVVHRDVTPSNVFVTYEGPTRVVDFGIASAADCLHHTSTGTIRGKFGYMSPDHFNGERPDRRADIWALGVVLWETIALRPLFRRENPSLTMMATLESHVPPLHEVVPGVDPALSRIAEHALAKKREDRYATAAQMAADLQQFLASSGAPSARAEVAASIAELFPTGEAEKRRLIKAVIEGRRSIPPRESDPGASEARLSDSQVVPKGWRSRRRSGRPWARMSAPWTVVCSALIAASSVLWSISHRTVHAPPRAPETNAHVAPEPVLPAAASAPFAPPTKLANQASSPALASARPEEARAEPARSEPAARPPSEPRGASRAPAAAAQREAAAQELTAPEVEHAADVATNQAELPRKSASGARAGSARHAKHKDSSEATVSSSTGWVSLTTTGDWAEIYHEGHLLGPSPGRFNLPEGRQTLLLKPGGGGAHRNVVVMVRADETVRVRADL